MSMTSRERMWAVINHQRPDRIPTDIWAVGEVREKLQKHFGEGTDWMEKLHIDGFGGAGPAYVGPKPPEMPAGEHENFWGMKYKTIAYATGKYDEQSYYPLAAAKTIDDIEAYNWPKVEWWDFSTVKPEAAKTHDRKLIQTGYMAPFTFHLYLRGLENCLVDPLLEPEFTEHLLGRLCDYFYDYHKRLFEAGEGLIDVTQVTDDYGMQTGPIMNMDTFRRFYLPHVKRFCDLAHSFDVKVFHHDDGAMASFMPDLVAAGIEVLNPIQWRCPGMDRAELKKNWGKQVCFHGGVDNQQTLPFGSVADVRAEVRENIDIMASDKTGYVLAPCHNIQAVTPVENILAMYDEAWNYGKMD